MNRRAFFTALAGTAAAAIAVDPEKLLWVPGRKLISIPKPRVPKPDISVLVNSLFGPMPSIDVHGVGIVPGSLRLDGLTPDVWVIRTMDGLNPRAWVMPDMSQPALPQLPKYLRRMVVRSKITAEFTWK